MTETPPWWAVTRAFRASSGDLVLADQAPSDARLSWRLSPQASVAYARRLERRARRTIFVAQVLLLLGTAATVGWMRCQRPLTVETLKTIAWFIVPVFLVTELWCFTRVRQTARKVAQAARRGLDVAVLLPSGVRIGPLRLMCGDQTGHPGPELLVDEGVFPPLLVVKGTYRSAGRRNVAYALEVPIAPDAVTGVKDWIAERDAKRLVAILGKREARL